MDKVYLNFSESLINKLDDEIIINKICKFLEMEKPNLKSKNLEEKIKELCVLKVCEIVGVKNIPNTKSDFFDFFSTFVGEAVCKKLNFKIKIAPDCLRLFRFNNINYISKTLEAFETEDVDDAFIDMFNLADNNKYMVEEFKKMK